MTDPLPAISEAAATGATAGLFADIRAVVGVRVVNLVWRHLATIDGALPLAWSAVRPLYVEGIVDAEAARFRANMIVPPLAPLAGNEPPGVDAVLASYDHSNSINLFALGALLAALHSTMRDEAQPHDVPARGARMRAPDLVLPPLLAESEVAPETWACVLRLNQMGNQPQPLILASMYRHLAHWPAFLGQVEATLAPVHRDGSLALAIDANNAAARARALAIAGAIAMPDHPAQLGRQIDIAVTAFVDHAIGRMVTICRAIRLARGLGMERLEG